MASTAAPELILRFPSSTQSQQPQRRRSENIGGDITTSAIVEPMIGVYQRTLSLTDNPTISSESDTGDQGEGEKDAAMNAAVADSSPVAAGHAVCTDDEDGDDDVFDTTPAAVTSETKNPTVPVGADGQYDDVSRVLPSWGLSFTFRTWHSRLTTGLTVSYGLLTIMSKAKRNVCRLVRPLHTYHRFLKSCFMLAVLLKPSCMF